MIIVHHLNDSRSHRVLWLLEELNIPYEIKLYQRDPKTGMAPELKAVHPLGKSPVISTNGHIIAESGAIVDHIIRHYGRGQLEPNHESVEYDEYVQWAAFRGRISHDASNSPSKYQATRRSGQAAPCSH